MSFWFYCLFDVCDFSFVKGKRLILRIEKRNDCFEREIECVVYEMRMSGHGWLLLRRWIDDDLYDRY